MGLDTFASRTTDGIELTEEDKAAFDEGGVELSVEGGYGGTFRGKVYDPVVCKVTGVSLYQYWIPPETLGQMAAALESCDPNQAVEGERHVVPEDVPALAKFFRICAERDLGLVGSW